MSREFVDKGRTLAHSEFPGSFGRDFCGGERFDQEKWFHSLWGGSTERGPLTEGHRYRPVAEVVAQRVGGEIVLVHLGTNEIFALNETGAVLWELLAEFSDPRELERELASRFDAEDEALRGEVDRMLTSLADAKLVTAHEG